MALFLMTVMGVCFIAISVTVSILSFYKNGKILEKKWLFILLTILILLELYISFMSLPSNYIIKKLIDLILMATLVGNIFLHQRKFNTSRLLLGVISILTLFALFEF